VHALRTVEFGHRKALGLVGVEQSISCVPAQLRDQLPRDVLCVLHAAVQTEPTVRREVMRGVARQEGASVSPAVRDGLIMRPGPRVMNLDRDVGTDRLRHFPFASFPGHCVWIRTWRELEVVAPPSESVAE